MTAQLAAYNAEVARGVVHTPEWDERMKTLQAEYDYMTAVAATQAAGETITRRCQTVGIEPEPDAYVITHKGSEGE